MSSFQDSQHEDAQYLTQRFMARAGRHRVHMVAQQWDAEEREKARLLRRVLRGFGVVLALLLLSVAWRLIR